MQKSIYLLSFISALLLSSCGVTPVAYTSFKASGTQHVYYSSDMYGLTDAHIEVYKNKEEAEKEYKTPDLKFTFTRCLGVDTLNKVKYTLVDLSQKGLEMCVDIYKDAEIYSASKKIYLNGKALTPYTKSDSSTILVLRYKNLDFVRTNPNGKITNNKVNTLEYK